MGPVSPLSVLLKNPVALSALGIGGARALGVAPSSQSNSPSYDDMTQRFELGSLAQGSPMQQMPRPTPDKLLPMLLQKAAIATHLMNANVTPDPYQQSVEKLAVQRGQEQQLNEKFERIGMISKLAAEGGNEFGSNMLKQILTSNPTADFGGLTPDDVLKFRSPKSEQMLMHEQDFQQSQQGINERAQDRIDERRREDQRRDEHGDEVQQGKADKQREGEYSGMNKRLGDRIKQLQSGDGDPEQIKRLQAAQDYLNEAEYTNGTPSKEAWSRIQHLFMQPDQPKPAEGSGYFDSLKSWLTGGGPAKPKVQVNLP